MEDSRIRRITHHLSSRLEKSVVSACTVSTLATKNDLSVSQITGNCHEPRLSVSGMPSAVSSKPSLRAQLRLAAIHQDLTNNTTHFHEFGFTMQESLGEQRVEFQSFQGLNIASIWATALTTHRLAGATLSERFDWFWHL